jgi:translation elongation factor EF-Tu-like GTPase
MTSENSANAPFRFAVESVFTIPGRGTAVIGYIQVGTIRTGDMLKIIREGDRRGHRHQPGDALVVPPV